MCCSINRRPLDSYVSFTCHPHHFLAHAPGSPARGVASRRGEFRTRAGRGTSKTWRFRHSYAVFSWALTGGDLLNVCRPTTHFEVTSPKTGPYGVSDHTAFQSIRILLLWSIPNDVPQLLMRPNLPSVQHIWLFTGLMRSFLYSPSESRRVQVETDDRRNKGEGVNHHLC